MVLKLRKLNCVKAVGSAFLQKNSFFIDLPYTLHSDRLKRRCTKGSR